MSYADLIADPAYTAKYTGSAIRVEIIEEQEQGQTSLVGFTAGINPTDDFEAVPIEEAGNDGVDEIAQGRHTLQASIPGFWSPERNDRLPTRQDFIGRKYLIREVIADERPQAGTIVNVYTGCVISRVSAPFGARGARTIDIAFLAERRYNGKQWAELTGT